MKKVVFFWVLLLIMAANIVAQTNFEKEVITTSRGPLSITLIGHGTLQMEWNQQVVQIDPWSRLASYDALPKATLVLITHEHSDHLDKQALAATRSKDTKIIANQAVVLLLGEGDSMKNGEYREVNGIGIEAVPAYNVSEGKTNFHPKGRNNGYVLTFGDKKIYVAGDTEDIPEMKKLSNIEMAFLPANQPYTMTPGQLANAVSMFHPRILIPYHSGNTDLSGLQQLIPSGQSTEIRIHKMN